MTSKTPKAFDFGDEPASPAAPHAASPAVPVDCPVAPKVFDFGDTPPASKGPPRALSFDDLPATPVAHVTPHTGPKALFDSEDHPAVRDALAHARADYPALYAQAEQRLAALFRRILPVRLALVTEWAEEPLMEQAALLLPITELVLKFTQLGVPALLEAALATTKAPNGMFGKLFRRPTSPAEYKPALTSARLQLVQLLADSEIAMRALEASAQNLNLHGAALAVVSSVAADAADATLLDALVQRRTLIGQAVRQAELSILQMGQARQQATELIGQVSSFLTVTLPAIEMAQAQSRQ